MRLQLSLALLLLGFFLLPSVAAASYDETSLVRCDSLFAAGLFAEAASCTQTLLVQVDEKGEGASVFAGDVLTLLLRSRLAQGGRLDPSSAEHMTRLLDLTRSLKGPDHPDMVMVLLLSGQAADRSGDLAAARTDFERALAIRSAAELPDDVDLAKGLVLLANAKARLGDYAGLGDLYDRALIVATETEGSNTALVASILANHAILKKLEGDLEGAWDLYDRTLQIQIGLYSEDNPNVARTYFNRGNLLVQSGHFTQARMSYQKSLTIREKVLGPENSEVARSLTALALLEKRVADLLVALEYAERALAIQQRLLPPRHPMVAEALATVAAVQSDLGEIELAQETLEQVQLIYEEAYGPGHLRVGQIVSELGRLRELAGDLSGALEGYDRGRTIYEASADQSDEVAGILNVEAMLLADMGRTEEAGDLAARSLEIRERQLAPAHPALGRSQATLGRCLWQNGEFAGADSLLRRALVILDPLGGPHHPDYLSAQFDLARVRRSQGAIAEALDLALSVERGRREALRLTVSGLPERLALIYSNRWPNGLNLAVTMATDTQLASSSVARVWTELIRSRGLVLDAMVWRRRTAFHSHESSDDSLLVDLTTTTRELAGMLITGWQGEAEDDFNEQALKLRRHREKIEKELWRGHSLPLNLEHAETVTLAKVAAVIPSGSALVGFVHFDRHLPMVVAETLSGSGRFTEPGFAAFVLPAGKTDPVLVDLGSAAQIDGLVRNWRDEAGSGRQVPGRNMAESLEAYQRAGVALRERIWDPLVPYFQGAQTIHLVPDGSLNLVNFAALPLGQDRYLIDEDPSIVYLGMERELVDRPTGKTVPGALLAFGAPDFTANPAPLEMAALPASAEEVKTIAALWRGLQLEEAGEDAVLALLGSDASEEAFKRLAPRYRALHVATHGFFLDERSFRPLTGQRGIGGLQAGARPGEAQVNPMLRSGLVLTGGGEAGDEDGILTAAEIAVLDLGGVNWVVLSACESGLGTTEAGEGVFGLRRAFRIAGAKNLLISLWPLNDEVIRDWMLPLYHTHLADGLGLVSATQEASRAVLAGRRAAGLDTHPQTWAGFIACGD